METLNFKTNINCNGCVTAVTPFLQDSTNIRKWKIDTDNPEKILTVEVQDMSPDDVINVVKEAGFSAEKV